MRWFIGLVLAVIVVLGLYLGSALAALSSLVTAVAADDGQAVIARTDLPALRRSLAQQIIATYMDEIGPTRRLRPVEQNLAVSAARAMVDALLVELMTPENLVDVLHAGTVRGKGDIPPVSDLPKLTDIEQGDVGALLSRVSLSDLTEIKIRVSKETGDAYTGIRLSFAGTGWHLSAIDLPRAALKPLIQSLPK